MNAKTSTPFNPILFSSVRFGKKETPDSLHHLADRMLRKFLESDLMQPKGRIIGLEEELRGELSPESPDLLGRIDLLLKNDDAVIVQDFKTSRSVWSDQQAENQSELTTPQSLYQVE